MIAKSRLQSTPRFDRGKAARVSSGSEASGEITLLSSAEGQGRISWRAPGASMVGGSDVSVRKPRVSTDRVRMIDARGSTGVLTHENANDAVDVGSLTARTMVSDGNDGLRVIFVLLMPEGARDDRYDELAVEPSRLMAGEGWGSMKGAAFQVDLPSATRFSEVRDEILAGLALAPFESAAANRVAVRPAEPSARLPNLTRREREVLQLILQGQPNKNIAADLRISMRTVENHRAKVMKKTGSKSLPALVRLAIAAGAMPDAAPAAA